MSALDPQALMARARGLFAGFTPGQRAVTIVAVLAVLVGGGLFLSWVSRPTYVPLFTSLSPADASAITATLRETNQPYELADGGQSVLVPQADVYQTRIDLSGQGLPAGDTADAGYSLLDKQSLTSSDFQQKVTYQRALEGELSKTIQAINGVQSAVVHLAVPDEDVFTADAAKPTGSVLVKTRPGTTLTATQVESIVHLVAGSVAELDPAQVTVADADGRVLNAAGADASGGGAGLDLREQQKRAVSESTAKAVQSMLDKVVGPGNAVVRVDATLNFDQQTIDRQEYLADKDQVPLTTSRSKESYTGTGTPVGGVLGPDNIGTVGGQGETDYTKEEDTRTNAVGTLKEQTTTAPGQIRQLSVAVLLDAEAAAGIDEQELEALVSAAAGLNAKRGDVVAVSAMPFDTSAAEQARRELEKAAEDERRQELIDLGKTAGLAVLLVLALLLGVRRSRRGAAAQVPEIELYRVPDGTSAPADLVLEAAQAMPAIEPVHLDPVSLERAQTRAMIGQLADDNPEDVARLLRGWIADRRP